MLYPEGGRILDIVLA